MAIEHACMRVVRKPWGSTDLRPWSEIRHDGVAIGELRFQRPGINAPGPALVLKLLFTKEPLPIQVHPDDAFAQSIGLGHGQAEAWYILAATSGAKIAVGLKRQLTNAQLRASIEDGSISDLVQWHRILKDDVIFVPADTLRAIGPGLVVAEIQRSSEATFGLFDHGRQREIH
jgi:mannose-6-phosphate isomerase